MTTIAADAALDACVTMLTARSRQRAEHMQALLDLNPAVRRQLDPNGHRSRPVLHAAIGQDHPTDTDPIVDRWEKVIGDLRLLDVQGQVLADMIAAARTRAEAAEHLAILGRIAKARVDALRRTAAVIEDAGRHLDPVTAGAVRGAVRALRQDESKGAVVRADLEAVLCEDPGAGVAA